LLANVRRGRQTSASSGMRGGHGLSRHPRGSRAKRPLRRGGTSWRSPRSRSRLRRTRSGGRGPGWLSSLGGLALEELQKGKPLRRALERYVAQRYNSSTLYRTNVYFIQLVKSAASTADFVARATAWLRSCPNRIVRPFSSRGTSGNASTKSAREGGRRLNGNRWASVRHWYNGFMHSFSVMPLAANVGGRIEACAASTRTWWTDMKRLAKRCAQR